MARPLNSAAHVWIKRALLLIIIGLVVQLFCVFDITPGSFMIFALLGMSSIGLGLVGFVIAVVKARRADDEGATGPADTEAGDAA